MIVLERIRPADLLVSWAITVSDTERFKTSETVGINASFRCHASEFYDQVDETMGYGVEKYAEEYFDRLADRIR